MAKHLSTFTEKLNYSISPLVLFFLAGVCLLVTYNARAHCWTPAAFTDPMTEYANQYCMGSSNLVTYRPAEEFLVGDSTTHSRLSNTPNRSPSMLSVQALSFLVPFFIWKMLKAFQSGIDINALSSMIDVKSTDPASRKKSVESMTTYLHGHLTNRRASVILICCYIFTLSLCLLNTVVQFFVLERNIFDRKFYPLSVVVALRDNEPWPESGSFPRVVLCDFEVRMLGNVHRHTVQCSLQSNDLLEKIFLFAWFWILFCLIWNVGAMIYWTFISLFSFLRLKFIERHLIGGHYEASANKDFLWDFAVNFIGVDGAFCLRLLESSCDYFVVSSVIRGLLDMQVRQKYGFSPKYTPSTGPTAGNPDYRYYPINDNFKENLAKDLFTIERQPINNLDVEGQRGHINMHTDDNDDLAPEKLYKPLVFEPACPSAPIEDD